MIPEAGQRFGPYEILGSLGGGGMGLVFRAWDERLHREVAVKLLHDSYRIPGMRERFLQEARAASSLNHPNICTVFDIGQQDGDPYLVMELLEGETLKDRIARGALPVEEIVRYAGEITDALAVAHAKGIVHRDIKPANIFLVAMPSGRSQAKVLDFGLAKLELEVGGGWVSRTLDLTLAGATVGTLAYMSPEQARGESLDMRSDLFSLGVVMYEMATRQAPFRGATSALLFVQLFDHEPEPVRNWNEAVPRELEKIILKLLAKDRRTRFQTAKELHEALTKIAAKSSRSWLQRETATAVPLVRAKDPVARKRMLKQKRDAVDSPPLAEAASVTGSSADNMFIRPMRITSSPAAEVEQSVLHSTSAAAAAEARDAIVEESASGKATPAMESRADAVEEVVPATRITPPENEQSRGGVTPAKEKMTGLELRGSVAESSAGAVSTDSTSPSSSSLMEGKAARYRGWKLAALALLVVAVCGLVLLVRNGLLRPVVLGPKDELLLTAIDNRTGDKTLDGTVAQGLEIALQQSGSLHILGGEAYGAGLRQVQEDRGDAAKISGQTVAQKLGAKAYVYGVIASSGAGYMIRVDVLKTASNDKAASLQEMVSSRGEVPAAIGRLAQALRAEVSKDGKAGAQGGIPFEEDATSNLDALHAYAVGEMLRAQGRPDDALLWYQKAVSLDPRFVQAQIRLAWLYRDEKAELAAIHAAELAKAAAAHAGDKARMLAQFCYEMNATGDEERAIATIRLYVKKYPHDVDGWKGLARVLRAQGYLPESLLAAQEGYAEDPFDAETYQEAEGAMVELDRYNSALQLETQARREGVVPEAGALAAGYMAGKESVVAKEIEEISEDAPKEGARASYAKLDQYGRYLDGTGRLDAAFEVWTTSAASAERTPDFSSAASSMLAQGALDRAFTERCTVALAMVDELRGMAKGPDASFNTGLAAALCGDQTYADKSVVQLLQQFPQSTAVTQWYVPELRAATDLGVNEPGKALQELIVVGQNDRSPLTAYLRGLGRLALGQSGPAIVDLKTVLAHRGFAFTLGGTLYPMAEINLARAYSNGRDRSDSVAAYQRFLVLWAEADRGQPLMTEALARSK